MDLWNKVMRVNKEHKWTDQELYKLADLWSEHKCLHDNKSLSSTSDVGSEALENITKEFSDVKKPPSKNHVQYIMSLMLVTFLKENLNISEEQVMLDSDEENPDSIVSRWKFYNALKFLDSKKVANGKRYWTEQETYKLIDLWSKHECLYNEKLPAFQDKVKRDEVLETFVTVFKDVENPPTKEQIWKKLRSMISTYRLETHKSNKKETWRSHIPTAHHIPDYVPCWRYYSALEFLKSN